MNESAAYSDQALSGLVAWETETGDLPHTIIFGISLTSTLYVPLIYHRITWQAVFLYAGSEPSDKESTLGCAGPGLESIAVRDWSTDEAYSERLDGDGGPLLIWAYL